MFGVASQNRAVQKAVKLIGVHTTISQATRQSAITHSPHYSKSASSPRWNKKRGGKRGKYILKGYFDCWLIVCVLTDTLCRSLVVLYIVPRRSYMSLCRPYLPRQVPHYRRVIITLNYPRTDEIRAFDSARYHSAPLGMCWFLLMYPAMRCSCYALYLAPYPKLIHICNMPIILYMYSFLVLHMDSLW